MTKQDLEIITSGLGPIIKAYVAKEIAKALRPLETRIQGARRG